MFNRTDKRLDHNHRRLNDLIADVPKGSNEPDAASGCHETECLGAVDSGPDDRA